jgi:hypothetical protein
MIATRLHVKRHSTSSLHRPTVKNIRHSSHRQYRRRASQLSPHDIADIDSDISEFSDEVHETTKVEKFSFY